MERANLAELIKVQETRVKPVQFYSHFSLHASNGLSSQVVLLPALVRCHISAPPPYVLVEPSQHKAALFRAFLSSNCKLAGPSVFSLLLELKMINERLYYVLEAEAAQAVAAAAALRAQNIRQLVQFYMQVE